MTKRETFYLLSMIREYYANFDINQEKVNAWYEGLKLHSFDKAKKNLTSYVQISPNPPKLSDLVGHPNKSMRAIPNVAETLNILYRCEKPAKEHIVQVELAKMRKILGIERNEENGRA